MVFAVHHLVWYLTQFMTLYPGDVINTGTPAGVALGVPDDAATCVPATSSSSRSTASAASDRLFGKA